MELKQSNTSTLAIVVKPDAQTELFLHLQQRDGQVDVHARCEPAAAGALAACWGQIQQSLSSQGINLAPLNQPVPRSADFNALSTGLTEQGFAQSNTGHQTPHPPPQNAGEAAESYTPAGFRSEPEPSHPAPVARRRGARWETWA